MKMVLILLICCVLILSGLLYLTVSGGFTKQSTVILTQDGRYIGIENKTEFRLPWQPLSSYEEVVIPWFDGRVLIPSGNFLIYHTIENPRGFFKCDGLLPDNTTIQDALNSLPDIGGKIVFPQDTSSNSEVKK
jgi:hypothetical protein